MRSRSSKSLRSWTVITISLLFFAGCAAPLTQVQPTPQPELSPENVAPTDQFPEETDSSTIAKKSSSQPEETAPLSHRSQSDSPMKSTPAPAKQPTQRQEVITFSTESDSQQQEVTASRSVVPDNILTVPDGLNLSASTLKLQSTSQGTQVGDQFILSIEADHVKDLFSAPFYLKYDPLLLEFIGLTEGKFLKQDGKPTVFIYSVDPNTGQVIVGLSRLGDVGGISGSGVLALVTFKAKNPGTATVAFQNVDFRDIRLEPVNIISEGGEIRVH